MPTATPIRSLARHWRARARRARLGPAPDLAFCLALGLALAGAFASPAGARESLGVFGAWGTFRDARVPLCYAIAAARPGSGARAFAPYVSIGTWPGERVRGQVHVRLSRPVGEGAPIMLRVGSRSFALAGRGADAWARGPAQDAAILAAIRSAPQMVVSAQDQRGSAFADRYSLEGAATAMDAASVACAQRGGR